MNGLRGLALLTAFAVLSGCAADYSQSLGDLLSSGSNTFEAQAAKEEALNAAKVRFYYTDFYTLSDPNSSSCAGDIRKFYDPIKLSSTTNQALPLDRDFLDAKATIKPAFIKNISVDLTDANANVPSNLAFGCSYGTTNSAPPNSSCASFDFGLVGGVPTTLAGSILLFGGISNDNFSNQALGSNQSLSCGPLIPSADITGADEEDDVNVCSSALYSLGVDSLPASAAGDSALAPGLSSSDQPISSFANLSKASNYSGPLATAGASITQSEGAKKVLLYGGSALLGTSSSPDVGADSSDSWIFDLSTQSWTKTSSVPSISHKISTNPDCTEGCSTNSLLAIGKSVGGRAYFGYTPVPGVSVQALASDGVYTAGNRDKTDRILSMGGMGGSDSSGNTIYLKDTHRFNPTFSPEFIDNEAGAASMVITQWMDSYHTQVLNIAKTTANLSFFKSQLGDTGATNALYESVNFGATSIWKAAANIGYAITAGGFRADSASTGVTSGIDNHGGMQFLDRNTNETDAKNVIGVSTYPFLNLLQSTPVQGSEIRPMQWTDLTDDTATVKVPYFGGNSFHQGFSLTNGELVFFGGVNCRDYYLQSGGFCPNSSTVVSFNTNSRYWNLNELAGGVIPPASNDLSDADPTVAVSGTAPMLAGMASARGLDGNGNPIIVAWGGAGPTLGVASDESIYYLYKASGTNTPTWASLTPSTPRPIPAINGAMVYSHVTQKFYLFGGYQTSPIPTSSAETWELSVSGTCQASGTCTFTWKRLDVAGGLTCYPGCTSPGARRGHRMVEVNYNNTDPTSENYNTCTAANPCSFGIFMEGGTPDNINIYSDRWMFDPTAHGSRGHWQRVDDLPPRHFAAMTSLSYTIPATGTVANRALLFGGESGLHSGTEIAGNQYFVTPTFGDTHVYDFNEGKWHRVELLGQGIHDYVSASDTRSELDKRQSFKSNDSDANRSGLAVLTPPPLSGATMTTRTFPSATNNSQGVKPLKVPEVYLFGGRYKDGSYAPIQNIHKFCLSSTGEDPVQKNGTCDAYDELLNPASPSPVTGYVGRWLKKLPPSATTVISNPPSSGYQGVDPSAIYSYLGASTYDPHHDRVVLWGGLAPSAPGNKVTQARSISGVSGGNNYVYEYAPGSVSLLPTTPNNAALTAAAKRALHGTWYQVGSCPTSAATPSGRYGHSLSYDSLHKQLVAIGGYDVNDDPLTQTWYANGVATAYTIPEIWAAKRKTEYSSTDQADYPCYEWRQITTFGNLLDSSNPDFPLEGLSHSSAVMIQGNNYGTGYYSTFDENCVGSGPLASGDPSVSKLLAGGVYIDIDRDRLGPHENLLLNLTYIPLGTQSLKPNGSLYEESEKAFFKIHLMRSNLSESSLASILQPRYLFFTDPITYPKIIDTLSVLAPANGQVRQTQLVLPIAIDPEIDRIRIERFSGSAILIEANIYRMGAR